MERIVYRKTLDVHKNGIQFTLQGFETADNMARTIEISLMASGDTIDLPLEQITALMYVTTPNATEPSINECTIKDNTIIYDVLPIVEEGITEMQLKLINTRMTGASGVLMSPRFAIEVTKSNASDSEAEQTTTYTALENAIANANSVYASRLERIELDVDCMFRAIYADGTVYESDVLKETVLKGEALLSQSYARGGTGLRTNEDTDNSMYYSNVSKSASAEANRVSGEATELLQEVTKHGLYTAFTVDFKTGEVKYISPKYSFSVDKESGELNVIGNSYDFDENINRIVSEWLTNKSNSIDEQLIYIDEKHKDYIIEQGTKDGWTYRKWNSGIAECWRTAETTATISRKYGDAHYYSGDGGDGGQIAFPSIDYPFPFITMPNVQAQLIYTTMHQVDIRVGQYQTSLTATPHYHLCAPFSISNELKYRIAYYAIGKWK